MWNFSADAVQAQLERILASPEFVSGPKLGQFLRYVVGQTLSGDPDTIKQYTIAVEGLGYDKGFDPTSNTIVRILAGRLRRGTKALAFPLGKLSRLTSLACGIVDPRLKRLLLVEHDVPAQAPSTRVVTDALTAMNWTTTDAEKARD